MDLHFKDNQAREKTSPIIESVPVCKGEREGVEYSDWKSKTMNEERFKSSPPPLLQNIRLAPPDDADRGRQRQAD